MLTVTGTIHLHFLSPEFLMQSYMRMGLAIYREYHLL